MVVMLVLFVGGGWFGCLVDFGGESEFLGDCWDVFLVLSFMGMVSLIDLIFPDSYLYHLISFGSIH